MKPLLLKTVCLLFFTLVPFKMQSQTYNQYYATVDVLNSAGGNPHDFIFSYDVLNGVHTCANNFEIVNNLNVPTSFNFRIYINKALIYTGNVALVAYGRVFFNDAYINCYSSTFPVEVQVF